MGICNKRIEEALLSPLKLRKRLCSCPPMFAARGLDFPKVRCTVQYDSPGEATEYEHRVGRSARLGERGESLLFLQPIEIDYLQDLEKHVVSLTGFPLLKVFGNFLLCGQKNHIKKFVSIESHPRVILPPEGNPSSCPSPRWINLPRGDFAPGSVHIQPIVAS